ncbi:MAG TPA: hypothetical protein VH880_15795 [Anaeromyxobacteraceae bacterium]
MTNPAPVVHVRRYPAVPELDLGTKRHPPPPPLDLLARLTRLGIRLRDDGNRLRAEVPETALRHRAWPALDRALARYAPYLADQAATVDTVRRRFDAERLRAALRRFQPPLVEVGHETVGGVKRWERLLAGPLAGAELDLACAAYARLREVEMVLRTEGEAEAPFRC